MGETERMTVAIFCATVPPSSASIPPQFAFTYTSPTRPAAPASSFKSVGGSRRLFDQGEELVSERYERETPTRRGRGTKKFIMRHWVGLDSHRLHS